MSEDPEKEECEARDLAKVGVAAIATVCGGWLILGLIIAANSPKAREGFGQIGDSFGVINSMFSAVAVLGAVYAVILQRKDLLLQREEFKHTLDEHQKTTKAQKIMAEIQAVTTQIEQMKFWLSILDNEKGEFLDFEKRWNYIYYEGHLGDRKMEKLISEYGEERYSFIIVQWKKFFKTELNIGEHVASLQSQFDKLKWKREVGCLVAEEEILDELRELDFELNSLKSDL